VTGRAVSALLLAAVPVGVPAAYASVSPASRGADLAVRISGAPSRDVPGEQVVTATVVNRGPGTANDVTLRFTGRVDSEAVNPESLRLCAAPRPSASPTSSEPERPAVVPSLTAEVNGSCVLPDLAPGDSHGLRGVLSGRTNPLGPVGELTVAVGHAGSDPAPADNAATTRLGFPDPADYRLYARGWDGPADHAGTIGAVPPGGAGDLRFEIGNAGQSAVNGFTVTIELPHQVAFAERRPGCAYAWDRRSATCTYGDLPMVPADMDRDPDDRCYSALRFRHRFEVDRAAPARARLGDGLLRVAPMVTGYLPPPVTRLPADVTGLHAQNFGAERDHDRFVVITGPVTGDGGGAGPDGIASPGRLPVTGAPIGVLGAAGLGLAAVGVALLLMARGRTGRSSRRG
jgi:hypothetical protein